MRRPAFARQRLCANVTRSGTTGYVSDYFLAPQNVAAFRVRTGLEFDLCNDASCKSAFSLRVNGNYPRQADLRASHASAE